MRYILWVTAKTGVHAHVISCQAAPGLRAEVDLTAQNEPLLGLSLLFVWSQRRCPDC